MIKRIFSIVSPAGPMSDPKPVSIVMWYFKEQKSWVVQLKDIEGNQVGDADYIYYKKDARKRVTQYEKQYGIKNTLISNRY